MHDVAAAIVGCGPRGTGHARIYPDVPAARLIACCDVRAGVAEAFATQFGIPSAYADLDSMLEAEKPDLVELVTPPSQRLALVERILALQQPSALLVEKPLALTPQDAHRILDLCSAADVALFLNHQLRFFTPFQRLRDLVMEDRFGTVNMIRASTRANVLEQGTHLFDMISALRDDTIRLEAVTAQGQGTEEKGPTAGTPRYIHGIAADDSGARVYFECGPDAPAWPGSGNPWHQFGIDLVADGGRAGMSLCRGWWYTDGSEVRTAEHDHDSEDDPAQRRLLASLLGCLDSPDAHPCGPSRTRFSLDAVFSALEAARCREWTVVG